MRRTADAISLCPSSLGCQSLSLTQSPSFMLLAPRQNLWVTGAHRMHGTSYRMATEDTLRAVFDQFPVKRRPKRPTSLHRVSGSFKRNRARVGVRVRESVEAIAGGIMSDIEDRNPWLLHPHFILHLFPHFNVYAYTTCLFAGFASQVRTKGQ